MCSLGLLRARPVLVPSLLHFFQFYQNSFFVNLSDSYCNTFNIAYNNYSNDDIQLQGYIAINIIEFIGYSHLKSNPLEADIGLPCRSMSPTKYTLVLEQKQPLEQLCLCLRQE